MTDHCLHLRDMTAVVVVALGVFAIGAGACDKTKDSTRESARQAASTQPETGRESSADEAPAEQAIPGGNETRTFEFTYQVTLQPGERQGKTDVFLPIATDTSNQQILERTIDSPVDGEIREESTYGNTFWHAKLEELPDEPKTITMTYLVERQVFQRANLDREAGTAFREGEREEFELFLKSNSRVPTSGELIEKVAEDIGFEQYDSPLREARAIYDYVVDTMEYKKVGDGWGNGDTYWACNEKYGNCTDFHALFTSLARYRDIPARFEIGFPVPTDRASGEIGGYHCWLDFYLPGVGWTPIDASEAKKHPELRETYFGTHPANRVQFSVGRDLQLGEGHDSKPLNFFIYPMVEVDGERYEGLDTQFSYEEKTS